MLGLVDSTTGEVIADEANDIFNDLLNETKCGWICDEKSTYILPSDSPKFHATIDSLINVEHFGPIYSELGSRQSDNDGHEALLLNDNSIEALKSLIQCSDFLDSN